jgi:hypothetical protein
MHNLEGDTSSGQQNNKPNYQQQDDLPKTKNHETISSSPYAI